MTDSTKPTSNPELDRLLQLAEQLVSQKRLTPSLLISLGGTLAAEVNKLVGLRGSEKKQLVCDVVRKVVEKSVKATTDVSGAVVGDEAQKALLFVVDSVLPASLDLAVAAARGSLDLRKVKKTCFSSLVACLPALLGACGVSQPQVRLVIEQVEKVAEQVDPDLSESKPPAESSEAPSVQTEVPRRQSKAEAILEPREVEATLPTQTQIV